MQMMFFLMKKLFLFYMKQLKKIKLMLFIFKLYKVQFMVYFLMIIFGILSSIQVLDLIGYSNVNDVEDPEPRYELPKDIHAFGFCPDYGLKENQIKMLSQNHNVALENCFSQKTLKNCSFLSLDFFSEQMHNISCFYLLICFQFLLHRYVRGNP